jgi:hypothetical protein
MLNGLSLAMTEAHLEPLIIGGEFPPLYPVQEQDQDRNPEG